MSGQIERYTLGVRQGIDSCSVVMDPWSLGPWCKADQADAALAAKDARIAELEGLLWRAADHVERSTIKGAEKLHAEIDADIGAHSASYRALAAQEEANDGN